MARTTAPNAVAVATSSTCSEAVSASLPMSPSRAFCSRASMAPVPIEGVRAQQSLRLHLQRRAGGPGLSHRVDLVGTTALGPPGTMLQGPLGIKHLRSGRPPRCATSRYGEARTRHEALYACRSRWVPNEPRPSDGADGPE